MCQALCQILCFILGTTRRCGPRRSLRKPLSPIKPIKVAAGIQCQMFLGNSSYHRQLTLGQRPWWPRGDPYSDTASVTREQIQNGYIPGQARRLQNEANHLDSSGREAPKRRTRKFKFPEELGTDHAVDVHAEGVAGWAPRLSPTLGLTLPSRGRTPQPVPARPASPPLGPGEVGLKTPTPQGSGKERARGGGGQVPEIESPGP